MIKAIVIDDEEMARDSVELFIQKYTPSIILVGKARSVEEGVQLFNDLKPEIVFLDINMPEKNGFAFLNAIDILHQQIIFTTAYSEFAIKALNMSACYYLLKPISPEDFRLSVDKALHHLNEKISLEQNFYELRQTLEFKTEFPKNLLIPVKNGYEIVDVSTICFLEGDRNYTWVYTRTEKYISTKNLKEYEEMLNPSLFFRIHQSHLVNKQVVKKVLNSKPDQIELENGTILNLSRDKKKIFLDWLVR